MKYDYNRVFIYENKILNIYMSLFFYVDYLYVLKLFFYWLKLFRIFFVFSGIYQSFYYDLFFYISLFFKKIKKYNFVDICILV